MGCSENPAPRGAAAEETMGEHMGFALPKGLSSLECEVFEPCVGEEFDVRSEPIVVKLRLDRITKHKGGPGFMTRAPFTLIWSSVPNINLSLGIYSLSIPLQRHRAWGPHEVYIERMLAMGERPVYQSVFY
jgi:hypothetical protein